VISSAPSIAVSTPADSDKKRTPRTVPTDASSAQPPEPILTGPEATRRLMLLSDLQTALARLGIRSVLARTHRLVLRPPAAPCAPSGQVNPRLHIFTPAGTTIATSDGTAYHLPSGHDCPAANPAAAATLIRDHPAAPAAACRRGGPQR